jgi:hypothetical protein
VRSTECGECAGEQGHASALRDADDLTRRTGRVRERPDDVHHGWNAKLSAHRPDVSHQNGRL